MSGITPLHSACLHNRIDEIKDLLKSYDVNAQDVHGFTPLYMACVNDHVEAVKCILESDVDLFIKTNNGSTVFTVSEDEHCQEILGMLFSKVTTYESAIIDYTNYRGERGIRRIVPEKISFESTPYHSEQWILYAIDVEKQESRGFAMKDIHSLLSCNKYPI